MSENEQNQYATRCDNLDRAIAEGRLIRRAWTKPGDRVCLLAALSPEVCDAAAASNYESPVSACPASVCLPWLARLTPIIDDRGSAARWPETVRRYAALAREWHRLSPEAWRRAEARTVLFALRALPGASSLVPLWERVLAGDEPSRAQWRAAYAYAAANAVAIDRVTDACFGAIEQELAAVTPPRRTIPVDDVLGTPVDLVLETIKEQV